MESKEVSYEVHHLPMSEVWADHNFNFRGFVAPIDVIDLARSIEDKGLETPITVQPWSEPSKPQIKYRVVAGHRRHKAMQVNKAQTVPAFIREFSEDGAHEYNLCENLERKDLNLEQEAKALRYFIGKGWTEEEMAMRFGQSRGWVQIRKAFLLLPSDIQKEAAAGIFTQEEVKLIARFKNHDDMYAFAKRLKLRKELGQKPTISKTIKTAKDGLKVRKRNEGEMMEMQDFIYDTIGPCLATRFAAWCGGKISTVQFLLTFKEFCTEEGYEFNMPEFVTNALKGSPDQKAPELRVV